ncbi:dethiobiotin synthase [Xylophilus sp. Kf1]|nr:dethiobiotin synthase [Xylophilus sp. Kf1]
MTGLGCFLTATDAGVGKTRVGTGLLFLLGQGGARSAGMKPVAAGMALVEGRWINEDVHLLRAASTLALTDAEAGPCQLRSPHAPHIAADIDGRPVDRAALAQAARNLAARCDWLVVEGVGGFQVPLGDDWDTADLAVDLGLPVVLVVGLRTGCLNHALLTAQAVQQRGLRLAGWVANAVDPSMPWPEDTLHTLRLWLQKRHGASCLGVVPWLDRPTPAAVAAFLNADAVRAAIGGVRRVRPQSVA